MGRNIKSNRSGYNVRAKLYSSEIIDNLEVVRKIQFATPKVFYAKDYQNFKQQNNEVDGTMQSTTINGAIETMDLAQTDIKKHDTVEYMGVKYNVEEVVFNDNNLQRAVSRRPEVKTIIVLGAVLNV